MKAYIVDTETTGQSENPECIELAHIEVVLGLEEGSPNLLRYAPEGRMYEERFKPTKSITYGAMAVHHIWAEQLEGMAPSKDASLPPDCRYVIGHSVDYDWKVLGAPANVKRICTLALARRYMELDSHRLGACIYKVFENAPEQAQSLLINAHQAAADVELVFALLNWLLEQNLFPMPRSWEDLWRLSEEARVPTKWTFGKFIGEPIEAADRGYLNWCLKQEWMDPYVKMAVRKALER